LLTPLLLPGWRLAPRHVAGAAIGFAGAALAIGAAPTTFTPTTLLGFGFAAGSAVVWACYSLLMRRVPMFSSWAIGGFALASGVIALILHWLFESPAVLRDGDAWRLLLVGLGPMGTAFYLWDIAMKRGDPRVIGVLAYATPLLSTALLVVATGRAPTASLAAATALVIVAAAIASRQPRR
jgi:drug/metabolite transporter (DMT)-like permease